MIKVEIKCYDADGASTWKTVTLTRDDLEMAGITKLRETDVGSRAMQAVDVSIIYQRDLSIRFF